jgi:hypothetical protein
MTMAVAEVNGTPINAITKSRLEDPIGFDTKVALLWELTGGFSKWDAFGKAAKRKALSELDKVADNLAREKEAGLQPHRRSQELLNGDTVLSSINIKNIQ